MKHLSLILAVSLLLFAATTTPAGARQENTPKEEVVYGLLDSEGVQEQLLVINSFTLQEDGTVLDYGKYAAVENLSSLEPIDASGSQISFAAPAGRASYQGTLTGRELPWTFQIQYYLDGLRTAPQDLAGKSGLLEIRMQVLENKKAAGDFYDDFALQVTVPLDRTYCSGISTAGATWSEAGSVVNLSYVMLPGEGGDIRLTTRVTNFEMDPIQAAGIRMSFNLPVDPDELSGQLDKLISAAAKLDKGAAGLVSGAKSLKAGLAAYAGSFEELNAGIAALQSAMGEFQTGLAGLDQGLADLSEKGAALRTGAQAFRDAAFAQANAQLAGSGLPELTPENYQAVLTGLPGMESLLAQLTQAVEFSAGVDAYTGGVTQLSLGSGDLVDGAGELSGGLSTLADGIGQLYQGAQTLNNSMGTFLSGLGKYRNGSAAFYDGLSDSQKEFKDQLDKLTSLLPDEGKPYDSFVSEENTAVNFLQFVVRTPGIHVESPEVTPPADEDGSGIWQKIKDLFNELFGG